MQEAQENEKPKAAPLVGIALLALVGALFAGLATFAGPCEAISGHDAPTCTWASRAVMGVGAVIAVLAIVRIFETDEGERRGLSLACGLLGFLAAAMPGFIIELCADPSMHCNMAMRPFVACVGVAIGLVGGIDLTRRLLSLRKR